MTAPGTEEIVVGASLPPLEVPLSRTFIVASAIASRDYQDVHHDPDLAVARGSKDIFVNILTSNALTERFAREWAGPGAVVERIKVRLGAPSYPGDVVTFTGRVSAVEGRSVELEVRGDNSLGAHVIGVVRLRMPQHSAQDSAPDSAPDSGEAAR